MITTEPDLKYWSTVDGNREGWKRLDVLLKAVRRVLPKRWQVEDDNSGAWYWYRTSGVRMGGYATPEWDGQPGVVPFLALDDDCEEIGEQVNLAIELTGDIEVDALRVALKVINQFERGY